MTLVSWCWRNKRLLWLSKPLLWWRLNGFSHFYRKQNVQLCRNNKRWHLSLGKRYVSLPPLCLSASIHGCFDRRFTDVLNCVRRADRESNLAINIIPVKMEEKQSSWRAHKLFSACRAKCQRRTRCKWISYQLKRLNARLSKYSLNPSPRHACTKSLNHYTQDAHLHAN